MSNCTGSKFCSRVIAVCEFGFKKMVCNPPVHERASRTHEVYPAENGLHMLELNFFPHPGFYRFLRDLVQVILPVFIFGRTHSSSRILDIFLDTHTIFGYYLES